MDHLDIVDLKTAKLGIAVIVIIAIQYIITGIAVIATNYAIVERDIVTLITIVLEILFVEQTTALLGILGWIAVPLLLVPTLLLVILGVLMTGWRCPMDSTEKSFVAPSVRVAIITMDMVITSAPPYLAPSPVAPLDQP